MKKGIDYKKIDMTEQEFAYYEELIKQYTNETQNGIDYFKNLFETDADGKIIIIKPAKSIPWAVLFFIQNLMINQQLRSYDERIKNIEDGLKTKKEGKK